MDATPDQQQAIEDLKMHAAKLYIDVEAAAWAGSDREEIASLRRLLGYWVVKAEAAILGQPQEMKRRTG